MMRRVVDLEALLHRGDGLENVRLAGPVPARAVDAAEDIDLDLALVGHRRLPGPELGKAKMNSDSVVLFWRPCSQT